MKLNIIYSFKFQRWVFNAWTTFMFWIYIVPSKLWRKNFLDQTQEIDWEMKEETKHDIQLEFGLTYFFYLSTLFMNLIISAEVANIYNKELLNAIKLNLMNLYDLNFND